MSRSCWEESAGTPSISSTTSLQHSDTNTASQSSGCPPETEAHLHYWSVQMTRKASKDEVLDAFRRSSRIALIQIGDGLVALNSIKELMADRRRPHDNLYEVALWADMLRVHDDEAFYAYMVDNQAIVIPETIDAIRALTGIVENATESIARTNVSLGIEAALI